MQYIYQKLLFLQLYFTFFVISHYKGIRSIDDNLYKKIIDAKPRQYWMLFTRYTAENNRGWRYDNNNYYRIKDGFTIVTSHTERRLVTTTVT